MCRFGSYNKPLLDSIFEIYKQNSKLDFHLIKKYTRILQFNNYPGWENIAVKYKQMFINDFKKTEDNNNYYILKNLDENFKLEIKLNNYDTEVSKTEEKLVKSFKNLKIKYLEQHRIKNYISDYYLPDLNTIVEYFGPDHFYPLQTQIDQKSKFRLKEISKEGYNIIIIPWFDYERCSHDGDATYYIKNLLENCNYKKILDSAFFYENYDMLKLYNI